MVTYKCPICEEKVIPGRSDTIEPCRCHLYIHDECLDEWLDDLGKRRRCNICKTHYRYTSNRQCDYEAVNTYCIHTLFWFLIVFANILFIAVFVLIAYGYTTFDYWYSNYNNKGGVYFVGWGIPLFIITYGYNFLCSRFMIKIREKYGYDLCIPRWKNFPVFLSVHYVIMLLMGVVCIIFQIIGTLFLHIFVEEKPFYEFHPNLATFTIGVSIVVTIGLLIFGIIGLYLCIKNHCTKKVRNIENFNDSEKGSYSSSEETTSESSC